MKRFAIALFIVALLCTLAIAHGGMEHILGTVVSVTGHSISVKTADGSVKEVICETTTKFLKGTTEVTIKDVAVGSRVVIHAHKHDASLVAAEVKISTITAPAAMRKGQE